VSRARRDDGRRSPSLRASELLFEILRADGADDGDAHAEACDGLVSRLLAKLYWTVKSSRDGVREREQLQLATLGTNPLRASRASMRPIATAIGREVRARRGEQVVAR
jgi:hypothetical protein